MKYFSFEIDIHGATVVALQTSLSSASLSATEIDAQISQLKDDLDRVAREMKSAVSKQASSPILP